MKSKIFIQFLALCLIIVSCAEDYVDTEDVTNIQGVENQIVDGPTAENALLGMYADLQSGALYDGNMTFLTGLWTDEMIHGGSFPTFAAVAGNDPDSENVSIGGIFNAYYNVIFAANNLISSVSADLPNITPERVDAIRGQAYGVRALCYFDLARIFGAVPLDLNNERTAPELDASSGLPRSPVGDVYTQAIDDLGTSISLLGSGNTSADRFSTGAALALRAQVYMEQGSYSLAQTDLETLVGSAYSYELEGSIGDLFGTGTRGSVLSNSETIFGIPFTSTDGGGIAFFFSDQPDGGRDEVRIGPALNGAFESSDARAQLLVSPSGRSRIAKYTQAGTGDDDVHVIRYSDVLLNLAEVYARVDDPRALDLINEVRLRANASPVASLNSTNYVGIIANERLLEFFAEGGDRYHTTKRLGLLDDIVIAKGGAFVAARQNLFPIPQNEIDNNSALSEADQNSGY